MPVKVAFAFAGFGLRKFGILRVYCNNYAKIVRDTIMCSLCLFTKMEVF